MLGLTVMLGSPAHAEGDVAHLAWRTSPHLVLGLAVMGAVYLRGVAVLWRRAGVGRGLSRWRVAAFACGWLVLVAALVSPLDHLAGDLASMHMVQHLAIMLLASPLIVSGAPALAAVWALPGPWRQAVASRWRRREPVRGMWLALSQPMAAWVLYFVVLWGWHLPSLYEAALADPLVHDLQHVLFFGAASVVWWAVLGPVGSPRVTGGASVLYLFTTAMHAMALGVFMTLSPVAWYPSYEATSSSWGLSALQDQQVAGAIMWMPAIMVYVVLAALVFWLWMRRTEIDARRLEAIGWGDGGGSDEVGGALARAAEAAP